MVRSAVAKLQGQDKELIEQLFGLGGIEKSETDIAVESGVTPQAVCKRKKRALEKLSYYLKEDLQ